MKKLLFNLMLMLGALSVSAQTDATETVEEGKYPVYCDLMAYNSWGVGKVKVKLDMGHSTNEFESIYEADGKKKKFNTTMDAVNYMAKRGWKVQTTYMLTVGMTNTNVLHYLLYKMVKDDKEIYDGLNTKED